LAWLFLEAEIGRREPNLRMVALKGSSCMRQSCFSWAKSANVRVLEKSKHTSGEFLTSEKAPPITINSQGIGWWKLPFFLHLSGSQEPIETSVEDFRSRILANITALGEVQRSQAIRRKDSP
jgi:hypothetical protein